MSTKFSKAYNQYGSSMGRRDTLAIGEQDTPCKLHLERVRLDSGGYDNGGAYWGTGEPLWYAHGPVAEWQAEHFVRAPNRETAKAKVRGIYPKARFFR